jgi:hypothetical protein
MNDNPNVHVQGYGVLPLKMLKAEVVTRLEDISNRAKSSQWKNVAALIRDNGVLAAFLKTIESAEAKLSSEKDKIAKAPRNESPLTKENNISGTDVSDYKRCPAPTQWEDFRKQLVIALSKTKNGIDFGWLKHLAVPQLDDQVSYPLIKAFESNKDSDNKYVASNDSNQSSWTDYDEELIVNALAESYRNWVSNFKFTTASQDETEKVINAGKRAYILLTKRG